ncbi:hypothetical protein UJ101_01731 [Flavobacteriaceae bacterium UJ101]|nr:hypothetical protein UJ101_01731 [Flavobacteriaceae bacterium UJ101]
MRTHLVKGLLISVSMFSMYVKGQEYEGYGTIITDRPDQTESPSIVPKGFLQVETGAFYTENEEEGVKNEIMTYNTTLLRYGISKNMELRLGLNYDEDKTKFNGREIAKSSGFSPLYAGFKIHVVEEKGIVPQIGFLGGLILPFTAAEAFKPEKTGFTGRFAFTHTLSDRSSLSYNLGAEWNGDETGATYQYTAVYGYSFTDKWGGFVEVYGDLPEDRTATHYWDCGVTYLLKDNIQLDVSGGTGFGNEQNVYISGGVSFRLPK